MGKSEKTKFSWRRSPSGCASTDLAIDAHAQVDDDQVGELAEVDGEAIDGRRHDEDRVQGSREQGIGSGSEDRPGDGAWFDTPAANAGARRWRYLAHLLMYYVGAKEERTMAKAVWNGKVLAESDTYETVEGNVYFPEGAVKREFLRPSSTTSTCPWKGQAKYYSLLVDGQENQDAAWYYPNPNPAARNVKGHIAFWRGVEVEK